MVTLENGYMDDWWCLSSRSGGADVEGTAEEWSAIAKAIREGRRESFKRCAVSAPQKGKVEFYSPRNSVKASLVLSVEEAFALAAQIDEVLRPPAPELDVVIAALQPVATLAIACIVHAGKPTLAAELGEAIEGLKRCARELATKDGVR